MNIRNWVLACAATAQLTTAAFAADQAGQTPAATKAVAVKAQTTCPVMGGQVDKTKFIDYAGKRIYVCCESCIATIKKDPAKYVKKLEAEGITLDKAGPSKAK
ncbi:MAG: hypothetical protein BWX70_00262 [Verrucomicrobia bacterium ADurb.Bin070]|nr:MAG: hypothetical protein BWX70_00262 [Verrucomicrobia bacterium ADurb.Bin070]